jgi:3-deoxy-D-manno-octulosonic acid kinase
VNNQALPLVPNGYLLREAGGRIMAVKADLEAEMLPLMRVPFDDLSAGADAVGVQTGRAGPVHLPIPRSSRRVFVRPYARGGLLAGERNRNFANPDRAFAELMVSHTATTLHLPVPELVGVTAQPTAQGQWRMEAWSWWIPDAMTLSRCLASLTDPNEKKHLLQVVAATLRQCHAAGLKHADLNSHNIIAERIPGGWRATVIDLDKASLGPDLGAGGRGAQLSRLYRSLVKEGVIPLFLSPVEFAAGLVRPYHEGGITDALLASFMNRCRRAVFWHSLSWKIQALRRRFRRRS